MTPEQIEALADQLGAQRKYRRQAANMRRLAEQLRAVSVG